jgi:YspA, cpYpsA-related SLOG family
MYRILITGDRDFTEYPVIFEALTKAWNDFGIASTPTPALHQSRNIMVIHGAAKGADTLAGKAAFMLGFGIRVYPAEWSKYGRGAGPERNKRMIKENKVDLVLAFHHNLKDSKGTKDMVTKALELGVPIRLHKSDGSYVELTQTIFNGILL